MSPSRRGALKALIRRGLRLPPARPEAPAEPESFRAFVDRVRPGYRWHRHCEALAAVLQRVADGELKRVMVFMPPRHGKSELASRLFPAYCLSRFPDRWVGVNSYGASLACTLSRAARDFYLRSGGAIRRDSAAVGHWQTEAGGGLWAAGVGGAITGKGFHFGIIDDPIKNAEEAASEAVRAGHKEWYGSTFYTREEPAPGSSDPDGAIVVIQTRWHDDDLSGWLLSEERAAAAEGADTGGYGEEGAEGWHVVAFEAIKEDAAFDLPPTCTLEPDWRAPGEALCPERRPLAKLRKIAAKVGEYFFGALFQQRPRPLAGGLFPRSSLPIAAAAPARFAALVRYWDPAGARPGKGDWTVGVLMGLEEPGTYWVLDVARGQWAADERNGEIVATAALDRQRYGRLVKTFVEQPPGLAKEATDAIVRALAGHAVEADKVVKDKVGRAEPLSAQARAGNVRVLADPRWNRPYLDVMAAFPFGAHDDDVDASSGAFNALARRRVWRMS